MRDKIGIQMKVITYPLYDEADLQLSVSKSIDLDDGRQELYLHCQYDDHYIDHAFPITPMTIAEMIDTLQSVLVELSKS